MATPQDMVRVTDDSGATAAPTPAPATTFNPAGDVQQQTAAIAQEVMREVTQAPVVSDAPAPIPAPAPAPAPETPQPPPAEPAAPVAETPPVPAPTEPESPQQARGFARLYDISQLPETESYPQAVQLIQEDAKYDPIAGEFAREAMFIAHRPTYHSWALQEMGVTEDKVSQFMQWVKDGARPLPPQPAPPKFPNWDERDTDGFVVIPGANGQAVKLDPDDPTGKDQLLYQQAKESYERDIVERQAQVMKAESEAKAAQERQRNEEVARQQVIARREGEFGQARTQGLVKALQPDMPKFAPGDEWMEGFLIHAIRGHLSYLEQSVDEQGNPATPLAKLAKAATPYIHAGAGRAREFGDEMDRLTAVEVRRFMDQFNRFYLRANKAEIAATTTSPQVQAPPLTVQTPAAPSEYKPQTFEDAINYSHQIAREIQPTQ